jgi:hypothetical protein
VWYIFAAMANGTVVCSYESFAGYDYFGGPFAGTCAMIARDWAALEPKLNQH